MKFINREDEIEFLNRHYASKGAEFIVVYGRRRVGKTELLHQFSKGKSHIYFCADMSSKEDQLRSFSEKVFRFADESHLIGTVFPGWEKVLSYIGRMAKKKKVVLVIDEFPYLAFSDKSIPSVFQKTWDELLLKTKLFLVLCGSYISFMEKGVLSYKSPLYGRRTGQIYLLPLDFVSATQFFLSYSPERRIETYATLGGVPEYLLKFDKSMDLFENIREKILRKGEFLYDEVRFLLTEELREPKNYFAVLKAIAFGNTKLNEIYQHSGLASRNVTSKYLDVLQELKIVEKRVPVTEEKPHKSRKGIYRINDNFIRFWFRYVFPNKSYLEDGKERIVIKQIRQDFATFVSPVFEDISIQFVKRKRNTSKALSFDRIGSWWSKTEEIDIVALNKKERSAFFAEVKWTSKPAGANILENLQRKSKIVIEEKKLKKAYYAIFSKSGFTEKIKRSAKEVMLFNLKDIFNYQ